MSTSDFQNPFAAHSSPYFSNYPNSPYQPFQGGAYASLNYGSGSYNYPGVNTQSFGNHAAQGSTIAPAALETYPNPYGNTDKNYYTAIERSNSGSHTPSNGSLIRRKPFDDNFAANVADNLPPGKIQGNVAIKDPKVLEGAAVSERLGRYVFIGKETLDSDDPKGVLPKITPRKSLKEMKRKILQNQGNEPFDARIRPALKKLKLSSTKQMSQPMAASVGTRPASPSSDEGSSSPEEDSDNESEYDDVERIEISPLPSSRPKDTSKAMEYDVIKILWHKRRAQLSGSTIRDALGLYWNLIKPVREAWKTEYSAFEAAEAKNDKTKVEHHRTLGDGYRKILDAGIQATAEHGHSDIVSKLSENVNLFLSFYQLLVDRFKREDFDGSTVMGILNVMVRCTSMNQTLLEKTKLNKILPKFVRQGNEATKNLVQRVNKIVSSNTGMENASVQAKQVKQESKPLSVPTSGIHLANGVKRQKASEAVPSKKIVSNGQSKPIPSAVNGGKAGLSTKPVTVSTKAAAVKTEAKSTGTVSSLPTTLQKTKTVVPKPASLLTGLLSASKKPGTSIASQKATQGSETKPPPASKAVEAKKQVQPAAVPKSVFSFADTLANLDRPKEVEMVKKLTDDRPPETEEEKKNRLRKEARRHLRVKWKPEASLVETRLFRHDPEEEIGHDSSMIRDATDVKNEGQMLKLHKDLELDEEDDGVEEMELAPWHPLTLIEFDAEIARSKNFEKYGGTEKVESPERIVQQQRELQTFIAVYALPSDIPFSPREPVEPYTGPRIERPQSPETSFGEGDSDEWRKVKSREKTFFASRAPSSHPQHSFQAPPSTPITDVSTLLKMLGGQQPQPIVPQQFPQPVGLAEPQPNPSQNPQNSMLENIFARFQTAQSQAPIAQAPQIDPSFQNAIDLFKQQQHHQPQYQQAPVYQPPPAVPQQTPDLSALLAQFNQQNSNVQQPAYNYQPSYGNDNDRKRPYDDSSNQSSEHQSESKRSKGKKVWKPLIYKLTRGIADM